MHVTISDMAPEDANQKAYVHWKSWQESYGELMGADFLETRTLEAYINLAIQYPDRTLVAKVNHKVIGFANYGPTSDKRTGELFALYVLRDYQHKGIGNQLLLQVLDRLSEYKQIRLWVLDGNNPAINFYNLHGFSFSGQTKQVALGNAKLEREMILPL